MSEAAATGDEARHRFHPLLVASVGLIASVAYIFFAATTDASAFSFFWDGVVFHIPVVVGLIPTYLAWRRFPRGGAGWILMAVAYVLWGIGSVYWKAVQQPGHDAGAFKGLDAIRLILYPIATAGLFILGRRRLQERSQSAEVARQVSGTEGQRPIWEAIAVSLATLALSITVLNNVQSLRAAADRSWTNVAYPIGDALLLTVSIATMSRRRWHISLRWWGLLAALLARFVANLIYLNASADGFEGTRAAVDVVFPLTVMAVAFCPFLPSRRWMPLGWVVPRLAIQSILTLVAAGAVVVMRPPWPPLVLALAAVCVVGFVSVRSARHEGQLESGLHEATTDSVTGLLVRSAVLGYVRGERGKPLALVVIDLVGFRRINEELGRDAGDEILRSIGESLQSTFASAVVGRLSGDEFIVAFPGVHDVNQLCVSIQKVVAASRDIDGEVDLQFAAWCGGVSVPAGWTGEPLDLLRSADAALVDARNTTTAGYRVFDDDLDSLDRDRRAFIASLRAPASPKGLLFYLQPKVNLVEGSIVGAEALARWAHPERGLLTPDKFLPTMTSIDKRELTRHVVALMVAEAVEWREHGRRLDVAVNVTASDLVARGFSGEFLRSLDAQKLDPGQFTVELTEEELIQDWQRGAKTIEVLRRFGVRVSIDDFGTGYSSLAVLHRLPFDEIKLDREFLGTSATSQGTSPVLSAAIAVASSMGVSVIAEGIETPGQRDELVDLGCVYGQGYFFARPMPVDEFRTFTLGPESVRV
jgi:diguanylate cyclase